VSQSRHLRKLGNEFLVGGLVIAAISLAVIVYDQAVYGGTDAVVATCVLFLWLGGLVALAGFGFRVAARAKLRSERSRLSPQWRQQPAKKSRSRR
jgi:hypothetical protein